jgi:photosystem II stability/assembly factor-like uncharacterized protein
VGGAGRLPARFYLRTERMINADPFTRVFRTDHDGGSWATLLERRNDARVFPVPRALAYDPAAPDRVYVGWARGAEGSTDGGATWVDLGPAERGAIHDLALSVDGQYPN